MTIFSLVKDLMFHCELDPDWEGRLFKMKLVRLKRKQFLINQLTAPGGIYFIVGGSAKGYFPGARGKVERFYMPGDAIIAAQQYAGPGESFPIVQCLSNVDCFYLSPDFREFQGSDRIVCYVASQAAKALQYRADFLALPSSKERLDYLKGYRKDLLGILTVRLLAEYMEVPVGWLREALEVWGESVGEMPMDG